MNPTEAHKLLNAGQAVLVDVREEEELKVSGLAEGALWMPTSHIDEEDPLWKAFKASLPKDKTVILYCKSGARSGRVAEFLAQDGYETVNLGGFCEWSTAGLPVKKV